MNTNIRPYIAACTNTKETTQNPAFMLRGIVKAEEGSLDVSFFDFEQSFVSQVVAVPPSTTSSSSDVGLRAPGEEHAETKAAVPEAQRLQRRPSKGTKRKSHSALCGIYELPIAYQQQNPKKRASAKRYETYKHANTYGEFLQQGGNRDDFRFDVARGFVVGDGAKAFQQLTGTAAKVDGRTIRHKQKKRQQVQPDETQGQQEPQEPLEHAIPEQRLQLPPQEWQRNNSPPTSLPDDLTDGLLDALQQPLAEDLQQLLNDDAYFHNLF
jgi:hypothetical protein